MGEIAKFLTAVPDILLLGDDEGLRPGEVGILLLGDVGTLLLGDVGILRLGDIGIFRFGDNEDR